MNCQEARALVDAYFDGELDLVRSLEIERHLRDCRECANALEARRVLRTAVREQAPRHQAPEALRMRVEKFAADPHRPFPVRWAGLAAAAVVILGIGLWWQRPAQDRVENEVVASHVRSLMANHLMDVASTDQHTVKPWFAGKLDFSPPVEDYAADGFKLIGGRRDYIGGRAVAALVYQHAQHFINVFVWPSAGSGQEAKTLNGYHVVERRNPAMVFWLVSDLNGAELQRFADKLAER